VPVAGCSAFVGQALVYEQGQPTFPEVVAWMTAAPSGRPRPHGASERTAGSVPFLGSHDRHSDVRRGDNVETLERGTGLRDDCEPGADRRIRKAVERPSGHVAHCSSTPRFNARVALRDFRYALRQRRKSGNRGMSQMGH
jgi:hypothetical protein